MARLPNLCNNKGEHLCASASIFTGFSPTRPSAGPGGPDRNAGTPGARGPPMRRGAAGFAVEPGRLRWAGTIPSGRERPRLAGRFRRLGENRRGLMAQASNGAMSDAQSRRPAGRPAAARPRDRRSVFHAHRSG